MLRSICLSALGVLLLLAAVVHAAPLSIRIDDHDFTFDVAQDAIYDYAGANPDHLSVHNSSGHYVGQYTHTGLLPIIPPVWDVVPPVPTSVDPYPIYSGQPIKFAGNLDLDMFFSTNDGPYTNPLGDTFDVSLNSPGGTFAGRLKITGQIATQGFPPGVLYPAGGGDITLLDIRFSKVTLLARAGHDTADLIEGVGDVSVLLGVELVKIPEAPDDGATFFKFIAPAGTSIFPVGAVYNPLAPDSQGEISGRISGEAGLIIPEPSTLALLILGAAFAFRRRA
jgi:hypothetical protein